MDLHRNSGSPRLVRLLADLIGQEVEPLRQDFTERQSQWLTALDTIKLDAALHSVKALAQSEPRPVATAHSARLEKLFQRVQGDLVQSINAGHLALVAELQDGADVSYAPINQRHLALQREMETRIRQLRADVRHTLASASGKLKQLAALDTVLENVLGGREHQLLSKVPAVMKQGFGRLRKEAQASAWQEAFGKVWRDVLMAEMGVRLEPVVGLIEALSNEVRTH